LSLIGLSFQHGRPVQDIMENMTRLSSFPVQHNENALNKALTKSEIINNQVMSIIGQMDDNSYLVEYLNCSKELLNIHTFVNRGGLQCLAESIIGNGLVTGSRYIIVLRNQKLDVVIPKLHDRQLIKYLLSGLNILETDLLDYMIYRGGNIFSAKEAGNINDKG
jgi:hypothetical protein